MAEVCCGLCSMEPLVPLACAAAGHGNHGNATCRDWERCCGTPPAKCPAGPGRNPPAPLVVFDGVLGRPPPERGKVRSSCQSAL